MMDSQRFGDFIKSRRKEAHMTLKVLCEALDISQIYLSDMENHRRNPMDKEKLEILARTLNLSQDDRDTLFDLAGKARNEVSADLLEYTMDSEVSAYVRTALRKAKENNATINDWKKVIDCFDKKDGDRNAGIQMDTKRPK